MGLIAFARANARWIGGAFLLTLFSSFGQTFFIGRSNAELRGLFGLTDGEFGLLYMTATLASAATLPFLGRTLDHYRGYQVARLVIPALAASCLLLPFAPNVAVLGLALFGLSLFGQGMMSHVALTETGRWFAASRGRATSLVVPGFQAGEAVFPFAFFLVAGTLGWRYAWVGAAVLLVVVVLPVATRLLSVERTPEGRAEGPGGAPRDWTRGEVLRDPVFYALLVGVLAPPFIGTTVFFHQDYLTMLRGYPDHAFPAAFPLMAVTTVTFALVCGGLVDRYGAVRLLPFFLIPLCVASLAVAGLDQAWGVYAFMVLFGVSYGFTSTLLGALWPEVYGTKNLGGIRAVVVAAMVFSTAAGPGITGLLIDRGVGLPTQMLGMAAWAAGGALVLAAASRRLAARRGWVGTGGAVTPLRANT